MDSAKLLDRIEEAGIVGLGGAVFPTAVKLASSSQKQTAKHIQTLIINGAECEPYITCDDRLMQDRSAEIVKGIQVLQTLLKPQKCQVAIEDNKPEAIAAMRAATSEFNRYRSYRHTHNLSQWWRKTVNRNTHR